jgi:transcriptional regulator with XRE-family HTH domain
MSVGLAVGEAKMSVEGAEFDEESMADGMVHWGMLLRRARENEGVTQTELAEFLKTHQTLISHWELGKHFPDDKLARGSDKALGANELLYLAYLMIKPFLSRRSPNWDAYEEYRKIEAQAVRLYDLSTGRLSGLLQTEDYMRALFATHDPAKVEAKVQERLARQRSRAETGRPELFTVIDEAVLWRVVGSLGVMRAQLQCLLTALESTEATIQILPFGRGEATQLSMSGMIILERGNGQKRIYSESLDQGHIIDNTNQVSRYVGEYDRVRAQALSQSESAELIRSVLEGMTDDQGFLDQEQLLRRERRPVRRVRPAVRYPRLRPRA